MRTAFHATDTVRRDPERPAPSFLRACRWPLALVLSTLILVLGGLYGVKRFLPGLPAMEQVTINQRFISELPVFRAIVGGNLEVGTGEATETFEQSDERYTGFGWVYMGKTVTKIQVPVTYRYHLPLAGEWSLNQSGNVCIVTAPRLRPALPVAIDTERMEKFSSNGWSRFDKHEQLDQLERKITPTLEEYAQDEKHMDAARQKFRPVVADFVRAWLLKENQWRADRFTSVIVVFEDEQSDASASGAPVIDMQKR
jgi:hypothetical protein